MSTPPDVELRQYLEALLTAQEKQVSLALDAANRAVAKAEAAAEKRFESVNEFRNTLKDQQATLVTRPEFDAEVRSLRADLTDVRRRLDRAEGTGHGVSLAWAVVIGGVGLAVALLAILTRIGV